MDDNLGEDLCFVGLVKVRGFGLVYKLWKWWDRGGGRR